MSSARRLLVLAGIVAAAGCGGQDASPRGPSVVANVGVLPGDAPVFADPPPVVLPPATTVASEAPDEQSAAPPSTAASPGDPDDSTPGISTADGSAAPGDERRAADQQALLDAETDPVRRLWLRTTFVAPTDSFAGGAAPETLADGNRVIVIGDSIAASTGDRYSGETCAVLSAAGWEIEVDAEAGRHVEFGVDVVDERLDQGFDVAVVMLGSNYREDLGEYRADLEYILDALAPRPTVIFTVTVFDPSRRYVNAAIYELAAERPNVRVIDWAGITGDDPELLVSDGIHLSPAGRDRFAAAIRTELGDWDGGGDTGCVPSPYTDDLPS